MNKTEQLAFDEHQRVLVDQQFKYPSQIASQNNPFSPLYPPFQPNTTSNDCELLFDRENEDYEEYNVEELNYEDYSR